MKKYQLTVLIDKWIYKDDYDSNFYADEGHVFIIETNWNYSGRMDTCEGIDNNFLLKHQYDETSYWFSYLDILKLIADEILSIKGLC